MTPPKGPRPRNAVQRAGDALVLERARQGKTLEQIGRELGVTREAVRQRLQKAGYTTAEIDTHRTRMDTTYG